MPDDTCPVEGVDLFELARISGESTGLKFFEMVSPPSTSAPSAPADKHKDGGVAGGETFGKTAHVSSASLSPSPARIKKSLVAALPKAGVDVFSDRLCKRGVPKCKSNPQRKWMLRTGREPQTPRAELPASPPAHRPGER